MKRNLSIILIMILTVSVFSTTFTVEAISRPKQVKTITLTNKTEQGKGQIKVSYKKVKGAKGYLIKYSTKANYKSPKYKRVKSSKTLSATLKSLKADKKYYVKVKAYKLSGKKYVYGKYSKTKTIYTYKTPKKVSITKVKNTSTEDEGKFKVYYKKTSYASGYLIKYSTNKSYKNPKYKYVSGKESVSKTITGLTLNKKYYVKVKAYRKKNGKKYFGPYSKTLTVVTNKPEVSYTPPAAVEATYNLSDYMYRSTENDPFFFNIMRTNIEKGVPDTTNTDLTTETVSMYNLNWNVYEMGIDTLEKLEYVRAWHYLYLDLNEQNMDGKFIRVNFKEGQYDFMSSPYTYDLRPGKFYGGIGSSGDGVVENTYFEMIYKENKEYEFIQEGGGHYYNLGYEKGIEDHQYINDKVDEIIAFCGINENTTKEAAIIKFCEYIAVNCRYEHVGQNGSGLICSVFTMMKYGKGICGDYANFLTLLCRRVGIKMEAQDGKGPGGLLHRWNRILVNGEYYYLDRTSKKLDMYFDEEEEFLKNNPDYADVTSRRDEYTLEKLMFTKAEFIEQGYTFDEDIPFFEDGTPLPTIQAFPYAPYRFK